MWVSPAPTDLYSEPAQHSFMRMSSYISSHGIRCTLIVTDEFVLVLRRNTLVCDSVDEARALAYRADERHKVVAVDGTMISKNGFMTGGLAGNESARASRWNDSALEGLKKVRRRSFPLAPPKDLRVVGCSLQTCVLAPFVWLLQCFISVG